MLSQVVEPGGRKEDFLESLGMLGILEHTPAEATVPATYGSQAVNCFEECAAVRRLDVVGDADQDWTPFPGNRP